jgi:hypothetical protein
MSYPGALGCSQHARGRSPAGYGPPRRSAAPASLRLYRASVSELFVIDHDDQRVRAEIAE